MTAMSESHSVFWVDWQFSADKQDLLEKFIIVCSDCLSFRKSRVKSFDVGKEMRCLPVYYIPEIPYAYVKVVPVGLQSMFMFVGCILNINHYFKLTVIPVYVLYLADNLTFQSNFILYYE